MVTTTGRKVLQIQEYLGCINISSRRGWYPARYTVITIAHYSTHSAQCDDQWQPTEHITRLTVFNVTIKTRHKSTLHGSQYSMWRSIPGSRAHYTAHSTQCDDQYQAPEQFNNNGINDTRKWLGLSGCRPKHWICFVRIAIHIFNIVNIVSFLQHQECIWMVLIYDS